MTEQEIKEVVKSVLAALRVNVRCTRCGWIGPEEQLYPSGSLARLTCPQCHDGYHWRRAAQGRWFTEADSTITCDPEKGCGDGTFYCSRQVAWMESRGLDYKGNPLASYLKAFRDAMRGAK